MPNDVTCFFIDYGNDVCFATVPDNIVRVKTLITGIVPPVGAQQRHGVNVHPVAYTPTSRPHIWIAAENVFGLLAESHFHEVLAADPFPYDITFPVYFDDRIITQQFVGDFRIVQIFVGKNHRVPFIDKGFHAGDVITHRTSLPLEIMVLPGHPLWFFSRIFYVFIFREFPDNIPFPIYLNEIHHVLHAKLGISFARVSHNEAARQNRTGKAMQTLP